MLPLTVDGVSSSTGVRVLADRFLSRLLVGPRRTSPDFSVDADWNVLYFDDEWTDGERSGSLAAVDPRGLGRYRGSFDGSAAQAGAIQPSVRDSR